MSRWIKGYKGIYRVYRTGKIKNCKTNRFLKTSGENSGKYVTVCLFSKGKQKWFYVHRIVATAFIPNPENKREVNHKDLNKQNNAVSNLEWVTPSENKNHAVRAGVLFNPRPRKGGRCGASKLSEKQISKIKRMYQTGRYTQRQLGVIFKVTQANIWHIVNNKTWQN